MAENAQQEQLLKGLFELFTDQKLTDVVLQAGQTRVRCHRNVLAATSSYFRAMFTSGVAECRQDEVELQGVDEDALVGVVNFMYCGEVDINVNNVQSLFSAASLFQLLALCDKCALYMSSQITTENCVEVFQFARFHDNQTLITFTESFICDNFKDVSVREEILSLGLDDFMYLIRKDELNIDNEESVFEAVVRWTQFKEDDRRRHIAKLFPLVRVSLLSGDYIRDTVANTDIITDDSYCNRILTIVKLCKATRNVVCDDCISPLLKDFNLNGEPRYGMFARDMLVFVGGGLDADSRSLTCFDPFTCKNFYALKPHVTFDFTYRIDYHRAVVSDRNIVYMIGGILYSDHHFESAGPAINDVKCYDQTTTSWRNMASLLTARCAHSAVCVGTNLFVLGGKALFPGGEPLASVERYDTENNCWTYVSPMPYGVYHQCAVVHKNNIYVLGGFDQTDTALDTVLVYDADQDNWTIRPEVMQHKRAEFGAAILDNKLYVCGGTNGHNRLCSFEIYDFDTHIWRFGPDFLEERTCLTMLTMNHCLYVCGGIRAMMTRLNQPPRLSESKDLWKFDLSLQSWQREVRLVQYANIHACVVASMNTKHLTESEYVSVSSTDG